MSLDSPNEKEAHENEPLSVHAKRCEDFALLLLDRYQLSYDQLVKALCELHDIGKLDPHWEIGKKNRVMHAERGQEILLDLEKDEGFLDALNLDKELIPLLNYFVARHHSSLDIRGIEGGYRGWQQIKGMASGSRAIELADSFGIFKLADFVSSFPSGKSLYNPSPTWPAADALASSMEIGSGAKGGVEEDKLKCQKRVASADETVFLTAPTGWGKTLVGLMKASYSKPLKLFYTLPTITAIRKMMDGIVKFAGEENVGEYFYFSDVDLLQRSSSEDEMSKIDAFRFFLPQVNMTTIDQLLLSLLKVGKYHMRRFSFRNSVIVVDEYHLIPAPMIGALAAAISKYKESYGFRFLFMTATPLTTYKEELEAALGKEAVKEFNLSGEYQKLRRHRIRMISSKAEAKKLVEGAVSRGKKVLVILNTVDRAIDFYQSLNIDDKLLIHSRFAVKDRYEKERRLMNREKKYEPQDLPSVLVATQVAEVSLDVSFDVLITDLAPVPSLVQRLGRVNRYGKTTDEENAYVITEAISQPGPYSEYELAKTKEILEELSGELTLKGEGTYLEMVRNYEELMGPELQEQIKRGRDFVDDKLDDLFALSADERKVATKLRGDPSVLAVPAIYSEKVRSLLEGMSEENSFEGRRRIYATIKEMLVPVPVIQIEKFEEEQGDLPFPLVGGGDKSSYDAELGLRSSKRLGDG